MGRHREKVTYKTRLLAVGREIEDRFVSLQSSEGANPANTLISDIWPPEL